MSVFEENIGRVSARDILGNNLIFAIFLVVGIMRDLAICEEIPYDQLHIFVAQKSIHVSLSEWILLAKYLFYPSSLPFWHPQLICWVRSYIESRSYLIRLSRRSPIELDIGRCSFAFHQEIHRKSSKYSFKRDNPSRWEKLLFFGRVGCGRGLAICSSPHLVNNIESSLSVYWKTCVTYFCGWEASWKLVFTLISSSFYCNGLADSGAHSNKAIRE